MTIYIGTGGYSDSDLCGLLYPHDAKKSDYLSYYATHYATVEVNSSFYAPIGQKAFAGMLEKSQGCLKFAVKLHQRFTHDRQGTQEHAQSFLQAISPLQAADCLVAILMQFPHEFDRTYANRRYLNRIIQWFSGVPLSIEFRHPSWHHEAVWHSFQQFNQAGFQLSWCSVDYPHISSLPPSQLIITSAVGYVRLHGRNVNWWNVHSAAERHDYRYPMIEMQQWAQWLAMAAQTTKSIYVFFQNTVKGHAVYNIQMLRQALTELSIEVK